MINPDILQATHTPWIPYPEDIHNLPQPQEFFNKLLLANEYGETYEVKTEKTTTGFKWYFTKKALSPEFKFYKCIKSYDPSTTRY